MKTIMNSKLIKASNLFEVLHDKLNEQHYELIKKSLEKSFNLWKDCDIELSITQCLDTFIYTSNQFSSKPAVAFWERIKEIDCMYMFGQSTYSQTKNEKTKVFLNILVSKGAIVSCDKICQHKCSTCAKAD